MLYRRFLTPSAISHESSGATSVRSPRHHGLAQRLIVESLAAALTGLCHEERNDWGIHDDGNTLLAQILIGLGSEYSWLTSSKPTRRYGDLVVAGVGFDFMALQLSHRVNSIFVVGFRMAGCCNDCGYKAGGIAALLVAAITGVFYCKSRPVAHHFS